MSALVNMDDDSDVEALEEAPENSPDVSRITAHLDGLRTMKRELDFRGTLLGKTWSELSKLLGKYQSELVTKYDQFESMLGADGRDHVTRLESVIEKKQGEIERFEKTVHDLETKLLEKDGEIVHLRTDVHKLRNEVSIKDNLISKLQNQMAKESMEYSTEISSLKEIIELENSNNSLSLSSDSLDPSRIDLGSGMSRKKRRFIPNSMVPRRDDTPISAANTEGDSSLALSMSMRSSPAHAPMPSPSSRLWRMKPSASASSAQGAPGTRSSMAANASSAPTHTEHGEFDIDQAVDTAHFLDIPTGQDITKVKMEITDDVMSALENPESTEGLDDYESQMMIQNVQSMATPVKQNRYRGFSAFAALPNTGFSDFVSGASPNVYKNPGWKRGMTDRERELYNEAARLRMRRYRERKRLHTASIKSLIDGEALQNELETSAEDSLPA